MKKELLQALHKVQQELKPVKKSTDGYNYKYADMATVWDTIGKTISSNGFVIVHDVTAEGVKTTAYHEHGEITSFIPFTEGAQKPQEIGSEITYFKRYNLVSLFNVIVEGDDDDAQTAQDATRVLRAKTDAGKCPICNQVMKLSAKGNAYCPGKYNGTCKTPAPLTAPEQRFVASLDEDINAQMP